MRFRNRSRHASRDEDRQATIDDVFLLSSVTLFINDSRVHFHARMLISSVGERVQDDKIYAIVAYIFCIIHEVL